MYYYFLNRNINKFNSSTAPETEYTLEVKEMSLSWPGFILNDLKKDNEHPLKKAGFATLAQIKSYIKNNSQGKYYEQGQELNRVGSNQSRRLNNTLLELGFTRYLNPNYKDGRIKINAVLQTVWIFPGKEIDYKKFGHKKIKSILEKITVLED